MSCWAVSATTLSEQQGSLDNNRDCPRRHQLAAFAAGAPLSAASAQWPSERDIATPNGRIYDLVPSNKKVVLTILVGLALIGLFAVTRSGVAILAIARFGASFNQIAEKNFKFALIAASQLSELSQTLVATAPEAALADTQLPPSHG